MVLVTGSPPFVHFLSRMWMGQEDNVPVISVVGRAICFLLSHPRS